MKLSRLREKRLQKRAVRPRTKYPRRKQRSQSPRLIMLIQNNMIYEAPYPYAKNREMSFTDTCRNFLELRINLLHSIFIKAKDKPRTLVIIFTFFVSRLKATGWFYSLTVLCRALDIASVMADWQRSSSSSTNSALFLIFV